MVAISKTAYYAKKIVHSSKKIIHSSKKLAKSFKTTVQKDCFEKVPKLITNDDSIFTWAKKRPEILTSEINQDGLVLVHRTNYFPENGEILSIRLATKKKNRIGKSRPTIHFSLNKSVSEHDLGNNWNSCTYSIIAPFSETIKRVPKNKIIGGVQEDFFFIDRVKLPPNSVILKHNPQVPVGKFQVSEIFDGIRLIETSDKDLTQTTEKIIKKMGFQISENQLLKKDKIFSKAWETFCKKRNFFNGLHSESPWVTCEMTIQNIYIMGLLNNNHWLLSAQKDICKILNKLHSKNKITGKKLGYDVKQLRKIIKKSKSPQEALQKIANKMKITNMEPKNLPKQEEIAEFQTYTTTFKEVIFRMFMSWLPF